MAAEFNPYHVWLGIPPEEQPANHYRLLGIRLFETSGDVIDNAADRQMAHLRTIQVGKHGDLSQRLLNEVAAARVCLLDAKKRAAYDQQLRAKLPPTPAAAPATSAAQPAASLPVAAALPQPADQWDDLLGNPDVKKSPATSAGKSAKSAAAKRGANNRNLTIGIGIAVALVAVVGIGIFLLGGSSNEGTLAFDWPANDRSDTTLSVDGVALAIPASGPWEYHYPAGSHRVVAEHLAYKLDKHVDVVAGERQAVPADWKPKAVLVLNWPLAQRNGAELRIDGHTQTISQHEPLEIAVEPGRRMILITRSGFAPIRTTATVAADGRELVSIAAPPTTAKLVFDWPADERKNAELIVDGHNQTVAADSDSAPFELTLPPGQHVVHITRTGFEPFNQAVELSAGTDSTIKPTWTPEKKIAAAPAVAETTDPVEATAPQPVKKLPIPAAAEQERIAKQLNELYKTSQPGPKDPAKAQELYDVAAKDGSSPAERYMLLMKGAEIAAAAGDLNLSLAGIDTLDADYEIDALDLKQKLLEKFIAAGKPDQVAIAIPTAEQLVDQAVAADRFDIAVVLATSASKAVAKSKIATHKEVEERLSRRRHDIHLLEPIHAAAKKAQETLEKTPADPEANLTVGRWLCFYKGDWTTGLPMLARGSDEKLKSLAEQEIKSPTEADQQVQLADAWWDLAQKEAGIARDSIHLHGGNIYQGAMPNLASALKKAAIEKRLAEIAGLNPLPTAVAVNSVIPPSKVAGAAKFPLGKWVDILRFVDTTKNGVQGTWTRDGSEIIGHADGIGKIQIPIVVDGAYEIEVEFTRTSGNSDANTIFVVGSHACMVQISADGGSESALDSVDGRGSRETENPTRIAPGRIENNRRYRMSVRVGTVARSDRVTVDVAIDGKQYLPHWEGNASSLGMDQGWRLPNLAEPGFAIYSGRVIFHSARLKMRSGTASLDGAMTDSSKPTGAPQSATAAPQAVPAGENKTAAGKWVDILARTNTTRDVVKGNWSRKGKELNCEAGELSRIALPVAMNGSYDFEAQFTRTTGEGDVGAFLSVASHPCLITLSSYKGAVSGIANVDGNDASVVENPTTVRPGQIENGQRHTLLASVRVLSSDRASIDVSLDGKPYLPHWEGNPTALSLSPIWSMPNPKQLGLAAYLSDVTFHSARLRAVLGHASTGAPVASPLVSTAGASEKPTVPQAFPHGQWVDVLGSVDTTKDALQGTWSRNGSEITCDAEDLTKIEIPVVVDGSYEIETEFTRTAGDGDVNTIFPVGSHQCLLQISADDGGSSGLNSVDGRNCQDHENPTHIDPGTIQTNHRYRLLIKVQVPQPDRASIDVALDGKRYLPHWEGNPQSLGLDQERWTLPNFQELGLGLYKDRVTFHSVRLRVGKGEAAPAAAALAIVKTDRVGGGGGGPFADIGPSGSILVGMHVVHNGVINIVAPVFRTAKGDVVGHSRGSNGGTSAEAIAKPGYAVGGMVIKSGNSVDGLQLVFMRIRGRRLDPKDSYESQWFGGQGGEGEKKVGGDGNLVRGIFGSNGTNIDAIGLIVEVPPAAPTGKSP